MSRFGVTRNFDAAVSFFAIRGALDAAAGGS